ncbi:MAG: winged helix-turn-helix domain-containing protein [Pseudomonadota bacterium]
MGEFRISAPGLSRRDSRFARHGLIRAKAKRIVLLLSWLITLYSGPSFSVTPLVRDANDYLDRLISDWAEPDSPDRLRMQIFAEPVIKSIAIWSAAGERVFPPMDRLPHVTEESLLDDERRLEALRSFSEPPAWDAAFSGSTVYYRCESDRCLRIDGEALMRALGRPEASHSELISPPDSSSLSTALIGTAGVAIFAGLILFNRAINLRTTTGVTAGGDSDGDLHNGAAESKHSFRFGPLCINEREMTIMDHTGSRDVSERELVLLRLFAANPRAVLSKDRLYDEGWGRDYQPNSRALDQQILTLRRKLDPERVHGELVETVHGRGYRFNG